VLWVRGWWKKSGLICYVFKARTQGNFWTSDGETCVLYCGDGRGSAGQGMANVLIQTQEWEMTEKLDGQEEERAREMHMATVEMRLKV